MAASRNAPALVHETLEHRMLFMNQYFSFLRWNAAEVVNWKNMENQPQTKKNHEQHDEENEKYLAILRLPLARSSIFLNIYIYIRNATSAIVNWNVHEYRSSRVKVKETRILKKNASARAWARGTFYLGGIKNSNLNWMEMRVRQWPAN